MICWFFFTLIIALGYVGLIYHIYNSWTEQKTWEVRKDFTPGTKLSIIISVRNESANIARLLKSIRANAYPDHLYEVIVVDDHSEDDTVSIIQSQSFNNVKLLNLPNAQFGKKAALSHGIQLASGELILVTDGDCTVPPNWLKLYASFYEENDSYFIAAPVTFSGGVTIVEKLQLLDLTGMMGVTQAGIYRNRWLMANGANMAFKKEVFHEVNGFEENKKWSSGDDMFLIHKIAEVYPGRIGFLKTPQAVTTQPLRRWNDFVQQRMRWATKNKAYKNAGVIWVLGFVLVSCLLLVLNLFGSLILGNMLLFVFAFHLFLKLAIDYMYLDQLTRYFEQERAMKKYLLVAGAYLLYIVCVGLLSPFVKKYNWKGRKVR